MVTEEVLAMLEEPLNNGLRKICGEGTCLGFFDCGHPRKQSPFKHPQLQLVGTAKVCPLAKYNVEPVQDSRPWYERHASETNVCEEEIFAICAHCENCGKLIDDGEYLTLERRDFRYCLDCPVKTVQDAMQECAAEAYSS